MSQTARAIVFTAPRQVRVQEIEMPDLRAGEVRVRVTQSGICGSKLGGFRGTDGLRHPGLVFGHELIGIVDAYGPGVSPDRRLEPGSNLVRGIAACCRGLMEDAGECDRPLRRPGLMPFPVRTHRSERVGLIGRCSRHVPG